MLLSLSARRSVGLPDNDKLKPFLSRFFFDRLMKRLLFVSGGRLAGTRITLVLFVHEVWRAWYVCTGGAGWL